MQLFSAVRGHNYKLIGDNFGNFVNMVKNAPVHRYIMLLLVIAMLMPVFATAQQSENWTYLRGPVTKAEYPEQALEFKENKGQWHENVLFEAIIPGGKIYLERNAFTYGFYNANQMAELAEKIHHKGTDNWQYTMDYHAVKTTFVGGNLRAMAFGNIERQQYFNYFLGNDPAKWASDVKAYRQVSYYNVYPKINLKIDGKSGSIKYDWIVRPEGNPADIKMQFTGQDNIRLTEEGLRINTSVGFFTELHPYAYQMIKGKKKEVKCEFVLEGDVVSFKLGRYHKEYELVIDPILVFSTYSGSKADNFGYTATYDSRGHMYTGGITTANTTNGGYPVTTGAYQTTFKGGDPSQGVPGNSGNAWDITISKYDSAGINLLYATYIGGMVSNEYPHSLVVDNDDNLVIMGTTYSTDYPVTASAYDTSHNGSVDIIVSKLKIDGKALLGSTYLGGAADDGINTSNLTYNYADNFRGEVLVDKNNKIFVASCTRSNPFPTTGNAYQSTKGSSLDGCTFNFDANLTTLEWSTLLGGNSDDALYSIDFDLQENIYLAGGTVSNNLPADTGAIYPTYNGGTADGFAASFDKTTRNLVNLTYFGTTDYDQIYFIELDRYDNLFVMGQTEDSVPLSPGVYGQGGMGQFIMKIEKNMDSILWSTSFGSRKGNPNFSPTAFLVDNCENIYVAGWGSDIGFGHAGTTVGLPITTGPGSIQTSTDGNDFYLIVFSKNAAALEFATFFGGNASEDHVDGGTSRFDERGVVYQSVCSSCPGGSDFPTSPNAVFKTNVSPRCSNAGFKIDFQISNAVVANFIAKPQSGCKPHQVQFTNKSEGGVKYAWDFGDGSSIDTTNYNPMHQYDTSGTFRVTLYIIDSNSCNKVDSFHRDIKVFTASLADFVFDVEPCGLSVEFDNRSFNAPINLWDFGDGDTSTDEEPGMHTYDTSGTYTVTLIVNTNTLCADTATYDVTVQKKDSMFAGFTVVPDEGCNKLTVGFTNTSIGGKSYLWDFGDGTGSMNKNVVHIYQDSGTFPVSMILQDSNACNISDTALDTVTVLLTPLPDFTFQVIDCSLQAGFTNASENAISYKWYFGDGDSSTATNPTHVYPIDATYRVLLKAKAQNGCSDTISKAVIVAEIDSVDANFTAKPSSGCAPVEVNFTSIGNAVKFDWDFGDGIGDNKATTQHTYINPGIYQVTLRVEDTSRCYPRDTIIKTINVFDSAVAAFNPVTTPCRLNVDFENNSLNAATNNWYFGDLMTSTDDDPTHLYAASGTYIIKLVINQGTTCADSISEQITIKYRDSLYAGFTLDTAFLCGKPLPVQFTNTSIGGLEHKWNFGDGDSSSLINPSHTYGEYGSYSIRLIVNDTSACNPSDTAFNNVRLVQPPIAGFEADPAACETVVDFSNTSSNGISYRWDFGDGDTDTTVSPKHTYQDSNTYIVKLIVNEGMECSDSFEKLVDVFGYFPGEIKLANIFTPDGDGINDCFHFDGLKEDCEFLEFTVYDRWGQLLYKTDDPNGCWDGNLRNGKPYPEGTYYYLLNVTRGPGYQSQNIVGLSGTITLIRGK